MKTVLYNVMAAFLLTSLLTQVSFARQAGSKPCVSNFCVSDEVLVCNEKWVYNKYDCSYSDSKFSKGVIAAISESNDGSISIQLEDVATPLTVRSATSIFQTAGCDARKNKICVGDTFLHYTNGSGSSHFESSVVGVNATSVLTYTPGVVSYEGGTYYIDTLTMIYGN